MRHFFKVKEGKLEFPQFGAAISKILEKLAIVQAVPTQVGQNFDFSLIFSILEAEIWNFL